MRTRYDIIVETLKTMQVYDPKVARDIDSGKEGYVKDIGGFPISYRRIREAADRIMSMKKGL